MLSKAKIKYIHSLRQKKFRQKYTSFIIEGEKMATEVLLQGKLTVELVCCLPEWAQEQTLLLKNCAAEITIVDDIELASISALTTPNKVLVVARYEDVVLNETYIVNNFSLYLDGVQDPGNMGSILRIADWFGIHYVFCSHTCVDIYNPKVVQAGMGAFLRVNSLEIEFETLKQRFPQLLTYGAVTNGDNIFKYIFENKGIIVLGNEGAGVSPELLAQVDRKISIPGGGGAESLNVAVAGGIIAAVVVNQKK